MSKTLEDILNGAPDPAVSAGQADQDATIGQADLDTAAVAGAAEGAATVDVAEGTNTAPTQSATSIETTSEENEHIAEAAEDPEQPANSSDAEQDAERVDESAHFVPRILHLSKAATLYTNTNKTKSIGTVCGNVRVVGERVDGLTPIEYVVIACGKKIIRRAFIHI